MLGRRLKPQWCPRAALLDTIEFPSTGFDKAIQSFHAVSQQEGVEIG